MRNSVVSRSVMTFALIASIGVSALQAMQHQAKQIYGSTRIADEHRFCDTIIAPLVEEYVSVLNEQINISNGIYFIC